VSKWRKRQAEALLRSSNAALERPRAYASGAQLGARLSVG
jgi:hypothetical protein